MLLSQFAYIYISGVVEKLGIANWALGRDLFDFQVLNHEEHTAGALAESWEQRDPRTYVVSVRREVQWHDKAPLNGRELTAYDVAYNFHRILGLGDDKLKYDINRLNFASVEATDRYTVVFSLEEPNPHAFRLLFDGWSSWIYPPEVIEEFGDVADWKNLLGTGPFVLTDWVEGSSITWLRNPNYWGFDADNRRLPYIDELRALVLVDEQSRLAALSTAKIDYVGPIGNSQLKDLHVLEGFLVQHRHLMPHVFYVRSENAVGINTQRAPFSDIRVRMAMQMAIDVEQANDRLYGGHADTVPQGLFSRTLAEAIVPFEEWSDPVKDGYRFDRDRAKQLLIEAGYPDGFRTELVSSGVFDLQYLELLSEYWSGIDVDAEVVMLDKEGYNHRLERGEFEMISAVAAHKGIPFDVADWIQNTLHTYSVVDDAERRVEPVTAEEQNAIMRELGQNSIDSYWMLFGPIAPRFAVVQPWIKGFNGETSLGRGQYNVVFSRLWVDHELKKAMGY